MRLVLIHGAPAVGKLTVARALAGLTDAPLVDNHAAIDVARMVFGFAAPGFWDLVHDLRVTTLRGAARAEVPVLITTAAYSHPVDMALVQDYEQAIADYGGKISPVHLGCSKDTLMARVSAPERAARGKIASPVGLEAYLARNDFAPIPREDCLHLSTEDRPAARTAAVIAQRLGLAVLEGGHLYYYTDVNDAITHYSGLLKAA